MSLLLASNHGQIIRVRPGLLRPWQPDPKVSLTATVAVAETNLGFAGLLALVGHKGRSGASSVASGHYSTSYPCHAEGSHTYGYIRGRGRQEKVLL